MRCHCWCHCEDRAKQRIVAARGELSRAYAYAQRALRYCGVEGGDVLEAAVACAACQNQHCEALSRPTPPPRPLTTDPTDAGPTPGGWHGDGPE